MSLLGSEVVDCFFISFEQLFGLVLFEFDYVRMGRMEVYVYVGIDVLKDCLDIYVCLMGEIISSGQLFWDIDGVVECLKFLCVKVIVLEVIGGYEMVLVVVLFLVGFLVVVFNLSYVCNFVKVLGYQVKIDSLDVCVIVYFVEVVNLSIWLILDESIQVLGVFVIWCCQVVDMIMVEKQCLYSVVGMV